MATRTYTTTANVTGPGMASYETTKVTNNSTSPPNSHSVNFKTSMTKQAMHEQKKKYLTAKYGAPQMNLIRKRLRVEDWVDERLRYLYNCEDDHTYDTEIDLDDVLDEDTDNERRQFLWEKVSNAPQSREDISRFIEELLEKLKTL